MIFKIDNTLFEFFTVRCSKEAYSGAKVGHVVGLDN